MEISISQLGGDLRILGDVNHVKDQYHRFVVPPTMHPHLLSSRSAGKKDQGGKRVPDAPNNRIERRIVVDGKE